MYCSCRFALNLGERRRSAPTLGRRGADPQRSARSTGQEPTCPPPAPLACRPCGDGRPRGSLDAHPVRLCGLGTRCLGAAAEPPAGHGVGTLVQLSGQKGCLVDRSTPRRGCRSVRALRGPAPSSAPTPSPSARDGRNVYVASSRSDAIAVFRRNARTGKLTQRSRHRRLHRRQGRRRLRRGARAQRPQLGRRQRRWEERLRDVCSSATPSPSSAATDRPALSTQARGENGCIASRGAPGCATGRALDGPDVVTVSPDGDNVYVGAFFGNAVAVFARDVVHRRAHAAVRHHRLHRQYADRRLRHRPRAGRSGGDGDQRRRRQRVRRHRRQQRPRRVHPRPVHRHADAGHRRHRVHRQQPARRLHDRHRSSAGANAVAVSADDDNVYVTSLLSNSLTTFNRAPSTGQLTQQTGTSACVIYVLAVGCSLGRAFERARGARRLARRRQRLCGGVRVERRRRLQSQRRFGRRDPEAARAGCVTARATPDCARGRVAERSQLGRRQSRRQAPLLGRVREQRGRRLQAGHQGRLGVGRD